MLAQYSGWEGLDKIGPPIPGALDFAWELAEVAEIVIFTSRCSLDAGGEAAPTRLSPGQLRIKVIEWLEKYKFPYSDVYTGQGKPHAAAFIDDRAVYCSPQADKDAFDKALKSTKRSSNEPAQRQPARGSGVTPKSVADKAAKDRSRCSELANVLSELIAISELTLVF